MFNPDEIMRLENEIGKFLTYYKEHPQTQIVLYGAGNAVQWYLELMKKYNIHISGVVDKKYAENSTELFYNEAEKIPAMSVETCKKMFDEPCFIISAPAYREQISHYLKKEFPQSPVFCFDAVLNVLRGTTHVNQYKQYFSSHIDEYKDIYHIFADDLSRNTYEAVIKGNVSDCLDYYKEVACKDVYFPELVRRRLTQNEVFLDVGAYTGDTVEEFIAAVQGKFKKIIAFEPDAENFAELQKTANKYKNIDTIKKGCLDKNTTVFFGKRAAMDSSAAHKVLEQESVDQIKVVRLDDIIKEPVTYIKMDIEGAELAVLKGGEALIRRCVPLLAICVYHRQEDMLEIIQFIRSLDIGYEFYLYHNWDCAGSDTVLIALPGSDLEAI